MAKYNQYHMREEKPRKKQIHPVWRGIGCLLILLIPLISYAGAVLLVQADLKQRWVAVPPELAQSVALPMVGNVPYLPAYLVTAALLALIGFGVITILYALVYSLAGPSRYGPLDAPPMRRVAKRRRA